MTYEEYISFIWECVAQCPKYWRKGQSVFNIIDKKFGDVARNVQYIDGIDCFHQDEMIEPFIAKCWERINKKQL